MVPVPRSRKKRTKDTASPAKTAPTNTSKKETKDGDSDSKHNDSPEKASPDKKRPKPDTITKAIAKLEISQQVALDKKAAFRWEQRANMCRQYDSDLEAKAGKIGDKVVINIDKKDVCKARGIVAIVYDMISPRGGILAATELGVISSHGEPFGSPIDRYGFLHEHATVRDA